MPTKFPTKKGGSIPPGRASLRESGFQPGARGQGCPRCCSEFTLQGGCTRGGRPSNVTKNFRRLVIEWCLSLIWCKLPDSRSQTERERVTLKRIMNSALL